MLTNFKLKLKPKRFMKSPRIQIDLEKVKDPKIAEVVLAEAGRKFAGFCVRDSDVDTLANRLTEGLLSTAEEVLGRQKKKIQPWFKNEVLVLYDHRSQPKQQQYTSNVQE